MNCSVFQSGGHSAADTGSAELEQKFLDNAKDVVEFSAGSQAYSLSFQGKQILRNGVFLNVQALKQYNNHFTVPQT